MEAELLADGRVKLVLPLSNLLLINLALWTTGTALEWDEKRFREPTGLSPTKVQSLNDEMIAVRYALEGSTPWLNPRTGEMVPPPEPRKIGSAWDELLKIEAKHLPDRRFAMILPHAKLAVFLNFSRPRWCTWRHTGRRSRNRNSVGASQVRQKRSRRSETS